jgi:hypothetical protein
MPGTRAPTLQAFPLPRERALAKLHEGIPLLHDAPVGIDVNYAAERLRALALDDAALRAALSHPRLDLERLLGEAFVLHEDHVAQLAGVVGPAAATLASLAAQAVTPVRRAYAQRLQPLIADADWTRGYCPICGSLPAQRTPIVRCQACGARWAAAEECQAGYRIELALPEEDWT